MRLAIHDYSQAVAVEMEDTVKVKKDGKESEKRIAIDATDLLILDWFTKFYPNMKKRVIDGKEYGWVKRSKVLEDLPILRITEKSVGERFRKLVHFNLLDYKVVFEGGKSCYFRHGESFPQLLYDDDSQRSVDQPFKGRSNGLSKGGQTPYKDRGLDSSLNRNGNDEKMNCGKPANSRCECGGLIAKNIQTGIYECGNCQKKFPMSQRDVDRIAMFDRMKEV